MPQDLRRSLIKVVNLKRLQAEFNDHLKKVKRAAEIRDVIPMLYNSGRYKPAESPAKLCFSRETE